MYQLYTSPGACSTAVHVTLNELETPFNLHIVKIKEGQTRTPEFLAINPKGSVPVFIDNGHVITQSAAIMVYLAGKHQSDLLPPIGTLERAKALEWLMALNSELHPAHGVLFNTFRLVDGDEAQQSAREKAKPRIQRFWDDVENRLSKNAYLAGSNYSVADILMTVIHRWSVGLKAGFTFGPNTMRVIDAVKARPAFRKAAEAEGIAL